MTLEGVAILFLILLFLHEMITSLIEDKNKKQQKENTCLQVCFVVEHIPSFISLFGNLFM